MLYWPQFYIMHMSIKTVRAIVISLNSCLINNLTSKEPLFRA